MLTRDNMITHKNTTHSLVETYRSFQKSIHTTVADESLSAFNDLKLGRKPKFVIFASRPEKTPIVVDNTSSDDDYESFLAELPENECEYAVYALRNWRWLRQENKNCFLHVVSRHRTSPLEDGICLLEERLETRLERYCRQF
ncbi:hypothetical protein OXX79_003505 [Metschnikowia pulcherrima]